MFNIYIDSDSLPLKLRSIILSRVLKEIDYIGECVFSSDRNLSDVKSVIDKDTFTLRENSGLERDSDERKSIRSKIRLSIVKTGDNSADDYLYYNSTPPGFIISHDIPLLSRFVDKGLLSLDDRGNIYSKENIKERLSLRNAMTRLRIDGINAEKTKKLDNTDFKRFADSFDKLITHFKINL